MGAKLAFYDNGRSSITGIPHTLASAVSLLVAPLLPESLTLVD